MRTRHASVVSIGHMPEKLARGEALSLVPRPGSEIHLIRGILAATLRIKESPVPEALSDYTPAKVESLTGVSAEAIDRAGGLLASAKTLSSLFGGSFASNSELASEVLPLLESLKQRRVLVLHDASNAHGLLSLKTVGASAAEVQALVRSGTVKALVFVGVCPEGPGLSSADLAGLEFAVSMTTAPGELELAEVEILLPIAAWTEREGSFASLTGQEHHQPAGAAPYGKSQSLVRILSNLSRKMNANLPSVESALLR
jgi:NADH dehydrogenase/NADH:ubiquinone oxidoreductase subunit G